jgi:hypothetical protein
MSFRKCEVEGSACRQKSLGSHRVLRRYRLTHYNIEKVEERILPYRGKIVSAGFKINRKKQFCDRVLTHSASGLSSISHSSGRAGSMSVSSLVSTP